MTIRTPRVAPWLWAALSIAALAALTRHSADGSALAVGIVNVAICLHQLVTSVMRADGGPVSIIFWAFILTWYCVGYVAQLNLNQFPWPDVGLGRYLVKAQLQFTMAIIAFAIGNAAHVRVTLPGSAASGQFKVIRLWLLTLTSIFLLLAVLAKTGGLTGRFVTRDEVGQSLATSGISESDTIQLFFLQRLPTACALVLIYGVAWWIRSGVASKRSVNTWLLVLAAAVLVTLLANPFVNPRYLTFSAAGAAGLGLFRLSTSRRRMLFAAVLVSATLVLYPLATYFKRTSVQSGQQIGLSTFTGIDFDGYQMSVNTFFFVSSHGFAMGRHILAAIFFFVPRSIWAGKPIPASYDVASARGYSFQNLSLPLWSELYLDASTLGMILIMMALGYFARRLDTGYAAGRGGTWEHMAVLVAVSQVGLIRGPLGAQIIFFGAVVVVGAVVFARGWYVSESATEPPSNTL